MQLCNKLTQNNTVCPGIVSALSPKIVDAITSSILSPDYFCEEIAPTCEYTSFTNLSPYRYVERVIESKPENIKANNYLNKLYQHIKPLKNRPTVKAVHFSDAHVDPLYKVGADS